MTTMLRETLETMTLLAPPGKHLWELTTAQEELLPIDYPGLQHLTLAITTREISDFRIRAPHMTSLHIVLDDHYLVRCSLVPYLAAFVPELDPGLRKYTISGSKKLVSTGLLLKFISPVFSRFKTLPLLTLRNLTTVIDIGFEVPDFDGQGRIEQLVFDNFKYCLTDDITMSGPSEPRAVDHRWTPLPKLLQRADKMR